MQKILADLDNADDKLNRNLELLRNSLVDPGFNTARNLDGDGSERRLRTLHDFVDDAGIEDLKSRLRHSIDQVQVWNSLSFHAVSGPRRRTQSCPSSGLCGFAPFHLFDCHWLTI